MVPANLHGAAENSSECERVNVKDYRKDFYFNIKLSTARETEFIINMKWIVHFHLEFKYISVNRAAASSGPHRISNSNILNGRDALHSMKGVIVTGEGVWPSG